MSIEAVEFIEIFEALPVEKKIEVTDFARFLFERSEGMGVREEWR
jgi:hypothetical protein